MSRDNRDMGTVLLTHPDESAKTVPMIHLTLIVQDAFRFSFPAASTVKVISPAS